MLKDKNETRNVITEDMRGSQFQLGLNCYILGVSIILIHEKGR